MLFVKPKKRKPRRRETRREQDFSRLQEKIKL